MSNPIASVVRLSVLMIAGFQTISGEARAACPAFVELPSGTVFDLAKLIADSGSPSAALEKARADLAQMSRDGECSASEHVRHHAECLEIVEAAHKAVAALEHCSR
ncbi:hypothetical protein LJ655_21770 [Paraburkholderia sp. MMS20-SJTN17]|uniref:Uncharacterized protein n=1 Tax=Paraburkholderia translucens TaxID=2886945 RepID=A0ABS8KI83_9BURK|nr:hypothetical protein [Paraburkholderia sp. MMS20-SJTN17]MCC8404476.1 hypothetical protein [Paraburkholderia sp. MMS20-SJTN17]